MTRNAPSDRVNGNMGKLLRDYEDSIETGFQLAVFQGPMCAEPVQGMAYVLQSVNMDEKALEGEGGLSSASPYGC